MGVVSQTNTLDRSLTVWENLYFHGRYFGMGKKDSKRVATQMLEVFRLADRADADVATLSGGMAQRLMVARSIVHRPRTLFLDEPTSGLDPQSRIALWEIIRQIHAEGQTVVLTTHYMEEADRLCERVAIMDHGKLLALDTPDGLKRSVGGDSVVKIKAGTLPDTWRRTSTTSTASRVPPSSARRCSSPRKARKGCSPASSRPRKPEGSTCTMCRSMNPRSRRSSSTSPGRI